MTSIQAMIAGLGAPASVLGRVKHQQRGSRLDYGPRSMHCLTSECALTRTCRVWRWLGGEGGELKVTLHRRLNRRCSVLAWRSGKRLQLDIQIAE